MSDLLQNITSFSAVNCRQQRENYEDDYGEYHNLINQTHEW